MNCVFCAVAGGTMPSHKIWEDEKYMAILGIFPNTRGMTVVFPKNHYSSYAFDLEDNVLQEFIIAVKKVAKSLDRQLETSMRTGLVFEGFGVDHVHAKLYPLHGEKGKEWKPIESSKEDYYEVYPGYISSHDSKRADDKELAELAEFLRED